MNNKSSIDSSHEEEGISKLSYVVRAVLLNAWPLGIVLATFEFFPFEVKNPLNQPNPLVYIVIWTVVGIIVGLYNFGRQKSKA